MTGLWASEKKTKQYYVNAQGPVISAILWMFGV